MAIRFKFKSSATFDSVDIGGQSSISIRDLKSIIINKKHLNLCQDFDLVFSDSLTGQEYKNENIQIPNGSSVIIKRVPAESVPSVRAPDVPAGCFGNYVNMIQPHTRNIGANDSNDFGVDLRPLADENLSDTDKLQFNNSAKKDGVVPRCSEELQVSYHKLKATDPGQSTLKDSSANEESTLVMQSKPKTAAQTMLERTCPANHLAMEGSDMPSELKCFLCRTYFKEAVMIPCCQHSFCGKCIRLALSQNGKCPVCSSTKCKEKDLLPNVSLRQAIERFLESQLLLNGSENDLHGYAPDGESGIQVMDAANVARRDLKLNPYATGKGSNLMMQNKLHGHADTVENFSEFEGENEPQNVPGINEQGDSCTKKGEEFHFTTGGGERNFTTPGGLKRWQRTCYMCGSPDHLIRDCPVAASSRTSHWNGDASRQGMFPGCAPPYWPGGPPYARPFVNMYGGPGMMMYNANMTPVTPFGFPSYTPIYGAYSVPRPNIWDQGQNFNMQHGYMESGVNQSNDGYARMSEVKHRSHNYSEDYAYSNGKEHEKISRPLDGGRNIRISNSDRSTSEKDMPATASSIQSREDRHEKHHRSCRKNDSDSSQSHHYSKKESSKRRRTEHGARKSDREFHSHSRSSLEPCCSSGGSRQRQEEFSHRSRHSEKSAKSNDKEIYHDRRKSTKYSDDDYEDDYHVRKRKRFH